MFTYSQLAYMLIAQGILSVIAMFLYDHRMKWVGKYEGLIVLTVFGGLIWALLGVLLLGALWSRDAAVRRCLAAFSEYTLDQCKVITRY